MWTLWIKDLKMLFSWRRALILLSACFCAFFAMTTIYKDASLQQGVLDQVRVGLIDHENTPLSRTLLENFKSNEAFSRLFIIDSSSEAELIKAFDNNALTAIVTIPKGFTDSLLHYENKPITVILNPHNPLKNKVLIATLESFSEYIASVDAATYSSWEVLKPRLDTAKLTRMNELYSIEMIGFALNRQQFFKFLPQTTIPSASPQVYFTLSILVIMASFMSIQGAIQLYSEWEWRCLQRYISSPKPLVAFIVSKILALLAVNGLLLMIIAAVTAMIANIDLIALFPFIGLCLVTFTAFAILAATLSKSRDLLVSGLSLLFMIFCIVGGNFIPLQLMPESIQLLARATPNYWLIRYGLFELENFRLTMDTVLYFTLFNGLCLMAFPFLLRRKGGVL